MHAESKREQGEGHRENVIPSFRGTDSLAWLHHGLKLCRLQTLSWLKKFKNNKIELSIPFFFHIANNSLFSEGLKRLFEHPSFRTAGLRAEFDAQA